MADDTELTVLKTLYRLTAEAICEEEGHNWRELKPVNDPTAAVGNAFVSVCGEWQRCLRCGETTMRPIDGTTTTDIEITKT